MQLVSAALRQMRPDPTADEGGFDDMLFDILDAWFKGVSVLEIDWHVTQTQRLGRFIAPRCTRWANPIHYAWDTDLRRQNKQIMMSHRDAAYAIANLLQGRIGIGPAWDKLDKQTEILLVSKWARKIEQDQEDAAEAIVTDLETWPELRSAWASTDPAVRDVVKIGIQALVYNAGRERSPFLAATRKRHTS